MKMKTIVCTKYGSPDVLQLMEVEKPSPGDGEVLIKIHASSVTTADTMMRKGSPYIGRLFLGLFKPRNTGTGTGFAGEIKAIGKDVGSFSVGDHVFGEVLFGSGTNAEYVCVPEAGVIALMPQNMTFDEAAPVCDGALTSMNFLQSLGKIKPGQKVLINGASGSLGSSAVQLAVHFGAEVTGVCSTSNLELVKSLGADHVIDYTEEDFTKMGKAYDIIYDTVGKSSFSSCQKVLKDHGIFMSPVLGLSLLIQMIWTSLLGGKKAKFSATGVLPVKELRALLDDLIQIIREGKVKSIIDRRLAIGEIVAAHHYVDTGHKKGNVVISMSTD